MIKRMLRLKMSSFQPSPSIYLKYFNSIITLSMDLLKMLKACEVKIEIPQIFRFA